MTSGDPRRGRVAVIGDVGGQAAALRTALAGLGADPDTATLPPDLTVVQVGDLIHRGPDSPGVIHLVRRILAGQPAQWVQLVGNHEAQYLAPPRFHWPERLPDRDMETLFDWWRRRRLQVGVAIDNPEGRWLVTHAGLTEGFWRHFLGSPPGPAESAAALNRLVGSVHEPWIFRPGVMLTGDVDLSAGPLWASAPDELLPSWLASSAPAPFDQIHGHSSTVDWVTGREYGRPELVAATQVEDDEARHATAIVEGRTIIGIDPGHGRRAARSWAPLVLEDAVLL